MTGLDSSLNEAGQRLYRQAVRDKIRALLNDPWITASEKRRGIQKLEQPEVDLLTLEKRRDKLVEITSTRRLAASGLSRREREALTPEQIEQLALAA